MNTNLNRKLLVAATGLAVTLTIAAYAVPTPKAYYFTPPAVGMSWVTVRHNTGSYGSGDETVTMKRGERVWQGQKLIAYEVGGVSTLLTRPDGAWVAMLRGDTPIMSWNPPANWAFPLEVGKTWSKDERVMIYATKRTIPYSVTGKVEAYDDVTVPAGTFKAFRVHQTDTLGNDNTNWLSPELGIFIKQHLVRTAKSARGPGTRDVELASQNILK